MLPRMDVDTLRKIAALARSRARLRATMPEGEPVARLGAQRALEQLAKDLEASADLIGRECPTKG